MMIRKEYKKENIKRIRAKLIEGRREYKLKQSNKTNDEEKKTKAKNK